MIELSSMFIRFKKNCETSEKQQDEQLKTHYYKGTYRQVFETVENLLRQDSSYKLEHVSKEHGEFSVKIKSRKNDPCIITIVAVRPLEIAVDLHISTEIFSLFGTYPSLKNEIVKFYEKLNKVATFIGTARSN
jgi:hypothetical protein